MVLSTSLSRNDILDQIWETLPVGSPDPTDEKVLAKLSQLTQQLIDRSGRQRLSIDPFAEVYERRVMIEVDRVTSILKDKIVLITGGQGFIGTNLIAKLQQFGVKKIVSLDITTDRSQRIAIDSTASNLNIPVSYYYGDVRDLPALQIIFDIEQPQIVFHLAAERLPGLAEMRIHQTVSTNILGCSNIIELCERNRVQACIFSSTGKASRYFTPDIYAASKKIAEWLFSDNTKFRQCDYGIVRFTHVVENSPVNSDMDSRVKSGIVSMHAPDRHIYTQNVEESVGLLLNALTILTPGETKLLAVKDIGWPINTLDLALHKILLANRDIPLYFKGLPAGYERHVFMGQLDLSGTRELLPMLNVLEAEHSEISQAGDTVISRITPFDSRVVDRSMSKIRAAVLSTETDIKQTVIDALKEIVISSFLLADPATLANILDWGTNPQELAASGVDISYHQETIDLFIKGMRIAPSEESIDLLPVVELETELLQLSIHRQKQVSRNPRSVVVAS